MFKCYIIKVYGSVQGAGYRTYIKERAQIYRITGYIENQTDGSVYIEAEGDEKDLEYFIADCKKGPPGAYVKTVDFREDKVQSFREFYIR